MGKLNYKILFVHGNSDIIGGQELSLLTRLKGLINREFYPLVVIPRKGVFSELLSENNIDFKFIELSRLSKNNPFLYFRTILQIFKLLKSKKIDIVNASGAYPVQYCLPAARLAGIPCVAHINNTVYSVSDLKKSFVKILDGIIVVSIAVKEDMINKLRFRSDKITVIYNPLTDDFSKFKFSKEEIDNLKLKLGIKKNEKIIGHIGQIIPRKGLECFIQMAKLINDKNKFVKFMIIGEAPPGEEKYKEKIIELIKKFGLFEYFILTGFQKKVSKFMFMSDIVVNCSLADGGPRVVAESLALGKPTLTTSVGYAPEIIQDGGNGYLFEPNDAESMAKVAIDLLNDDILRENIGLRAKEAMAHKFPADYNCDKLTQLYLSLLNNKNNILFYESSSGEGGSANALLNIVNNLDKERFIPIVLATKIGTKINSIKNSEIIKLRPYPEPEKLSFFSFLFFIVKNHIPEIWKIYLTIRNLKVSLLHINTNAMSGAAIIAAKLAGIPCVCHIRETRKLLRREKIYSRLVDRFIVLNKDSYEIYGQYISKNKISIIYDGLTLSEFNNINTEDFIQEFSLNSTPLVGVAGRVVTGKGQKEFILSAKEVLKTCSKTKFIVIGDARGSQDNYFQEAKDLVLNEKLNENVIFTGWRNNLKNIFSALDIIILPSTTFPEGLPNVIIEAMAFKKPVIATNIPGPSDIVTDGVTGFLVPPGDIKAMAEKIIYLLNNPDLARKMGEAGRKRVEALFNIEDRVKDIENIYVELLKN